MNVGYKGLTDTEVQERRSRFGSNVLTPPEKDPLWKEFLEKFKDPLIIVLLVVLLFSMGISCFEYFKLGLPATVFLEPLGVLIALLLATGVGFAFEVKAARAFDVLNQVKDETPVKVLRRSAGETEESLRQVPRSEVVVDDIVFVETGEEVPADGILLESASLSVNESTLTGEPLAHKGVGMAEGVGNDHQTTYRADQMMKGTTVMEGHGVMQVTAVGDQTEYGHVYTAAQIDNGIHTPLNRQLNQLGRWISNASFVIGALIVVGRLIYLFADGDSSNNDQGIEVIQYILNSIMIAVTLIVVAVPEGLPLSITLSLALSMKKMLKENNLVRKLHACETMGAATVICTDKTGTLTQNRMQVSDFLIADSDTDELALAIAVNSTAWLDAAGQVLGNPTEGALLLWMKGHGYDYAALRQSVKVFGQEPFTTETKRMTTTLESGVSYIKGAPEQLLSLCDMTDGQRQDVERQLSDFQHRAMRTLGFVRKDETGCRWMALAAIADPVREEVPAAIGLCRQAGIRVIIVTGDTIGTAREIGRQIGVIDADSMNDDEVMTGEAFAAMDDNRLKQEVLPKLRILSRARPMDKQRLVRLLQQMREVVAVTGDGTNDAPALNAAHVGLSMGDGTAVAKEASDITIIDNSFSSITKAVMWGRSLYNNIGRFILFQMTVNVAACFIVLVGAFLGKESPLGVTQMLWVNLIMDTFAAMALSALPPEPSVMLVPPRSSRAHIINRGMTSHILGWGIVMSALLLYCWLSGRVSHDLFFTIFVMLQFWNLFNARYFRTGRSLIRDLMRGREGRETMRRQMSWGFLGIAALILVGQIVIVSFGGEMFNIARALTIVEWLLIIFGTSPVFIIGELLRLKK